MQELSMEECKMIQLGILLNVDKFCETHHIKYSLGYGTLLGAIRHKGFIPWDDDIDIIMMRDDYERFVASYKDNRYELVPGDKMPNHLHVRVADPSVELVFFEEKRKKYNSGLWIDVFPIDRVPDNEKEYRHILKKIKLFVNLQTTGELWRNSIFTYLAHIILYPFSGFFTKLAKNEMLKNYGAQTNSVASLAVWYLHSPSFPLSYMDEYVDVTFEGHNVKSIKHYDDYLRRIYGDYMQLPPVEKRKPKHEYVAYRKE